MGLYEERVLPHIIDLVLGGKAMGKLRRRALEGVSGTVLEVGFGSGTNLAYYPAEVERVLAVDPSGTAQKMASKRIRERGIPVEFVGLNGARLPLDDESVDNAVSTWTLCTIPDVSSALTEIYRVLKPGGKLYFLEHGLADDPALAARQNRRDGLQQRIAGGCHLNRDHTALIETSPLHLDRVANFTIAGPKTMGYMYAGTASRS